MKVDGCKVLVVGGARGIGKAVCELLTSKGAKICIGDILEDEGKDTVAAINEAHGQDTTFFIKCDVQNESDVTDMFSAALEKLGSLNVVISMFAFCGESKIEQCINTNLHGIIRVTQQALKMMGKDHGGQGGLLINTASCVSVMPSPALPVYVATKHGVMGYTRSMALPENFALHGVRINMTCPYAVETKFIGGDMDSISPETWSQYWATIKDNLLQPSTVAEAYLQIIEDDSLNGQALRISQERGIELYKFDMDHPYQ